MKNYTVRPLCVRMFRQASVIVSGLALIVGGVASPTTHASGQKINDQFSTAAAQLQSLAAEKDARTAAQQKIEPNLLFAAKMARGQSVANGLPVLETGVVIATDGRTPVEIRARVTPQTLTLIEKLGGEVIRSFAFADTIEARIPAANLETLAAEAEVKFITSPSKPILNRGARPALADRKQKVRSQVQAAMAQLAQNGGAITNVGSVTAQGDVTHRANKARSVFQANGRGIRIGVLSDSFNNQAGAATDVLNGDLPGMGNPNGFTTPVQLVGSGDFPSGGIDEGRAMLQIIHDVAPGAQLFFATAFNSITDFAANIRALRNAGCDIIVDDVFFLIETGLHDGQPNSTPLNMAVVTQAVNDVTAGGALYFSSAGNAGNLNDGQSGAWEGDFVSGGNVAGLGDALLFSPGNASNGVTAGATVTMQWSDPLGGSANDYDLYILNSSLTQVLASSTGVQNGDDDPFEGVQVPSDASGARIVVVRRSGAARFISLSTNRGRLQFGTSGQIRGHAGALNAFAVAATPAANFAPAPNPTGPFPNPFNATNKVELFSSDGPRRVFFRANGSAFTPNNFLAGNGGGVVRQKPEITAADGVSTTLPANSGLNPFFGTSAAAPHAAAIAGLIKSARPALTNGQIRAALIGATIDIEAANVDRDSGAGVVDAFRSVGRAFGVAGRAGDFNGDGRADLVFRNADNGDVIVWLFNAGGTTFTSTRIANVPANSGWEIQGVGDFNGDGRSDLIWRNLATGEIVTWLFNLGGATFIGATIFNLGIDSGWEIQTVGDFNGDGRSDLMWRNYITGEVGPWLFNVGGTTFTGSTIFNLAVGTGWQIQSAGDFNGDGRTDLMWRNTITGEVGPWLFNAGGTTFTGVTLTTVDPNAGWEIQGVGDFNGDGRADLMWRNAVTGEVGPWIFNAGGTSFVGSIIANVATNTGWQIQRVGDFNGDGRADLMWRNLTTGEVGPWIFNAGGTSFVGSIIANLPQSGGQNISSPR